MRGGDVVTRGRRETATRRHGDAETRGQRKRNCFRCRRGFRCVSVFARLLVDAAQCLFVAVSQCLLVAVSSPLLVAASPRLRVSASQSPASLMSPVFIAGSLSRAVFVAALAVSAYALVRYWQSLKGVAQASRWALIGLRGVALLLLACALAGLSVEYESEAGGRVLARRIGGAANRAGESAAASGGEEQQRAQAIVNALKKRVPGVVEATDESAGVKTDESMAVKMDESVAVANDGDADEGNFVAGVLLTDGAMAADEAALEVNRVSAATGGAPVFVVGGLRQPASPSVALESAAVMGQAVRGVPLVVRCSVHGRGMSGRESLVTIADEAQTLASARVAWTGADEWQAVELEVVPKTGGRVDYTARIEAAGGEAASALARPLGLYVAERRWRVLFFEGEPTWEAKFIRRALERSALFEVDYFAQVSRAAAIGATEKAGVEQDDAKTQRRGDAASDKERAEAKKDRAAEGGSPEAKLRAALASAERLNNYDCVIVGATPNEMLSIAEAERLSVWVLRRGGGLVILGGNSFAGSIVAPNGKLYKLAPAAIDARGFSTEAQTVSRGTPLEAEKKREGLTLVPTAAGASGALGGYLSASLETAGKGDMLTGQGLRPGALRPGASVLAVAGRGQLKGTSEAGSTLMAAARYGAGRTLLFAPADSWRLRTTSAGGEQETRDAPYNALWQGLLLWATAGAQPPVELTLSDESPAAGRVLTAELRVRDASFAPAKIERLNARLQPLTEDAAEASAANATPPREVAFVPDETDASVWRASLVLAAPGQYALEVDYDAGGKSGTASKSFSVVAASALEPGAARDTLSRAARETGGALFASDETDALLERIAALPPKRAPARRTWELRAWWPLAFIIPLLLSAAWLIERLKADGTNGGAHDAP
jgi:hypothetical protein